MDLVVAKAWVLRIRWLLWGAAAMVAVATELWLSPGIPRVGVAAIISVGALSNIALQWRPSVRGLHTLIIGDTLLLTALFAVCGGASNPFTFLYVLPVVLAALVAPAPLTWITMLLAGGGYASLFLIEDPHAHHHGPDQMRAHLAGMWVAYGITASILALGVTRVRAAANEAAAALAAAEGLQRRTERLAALATLAAGAAHELGTPLATISVIAGELERRAPDEQAGEDGRLLALEVERCRNILGQLAADAGAGMAEAPVRIALVDLVDETLEGQSWAPHIHRDLNAQDAVEVSLPVTLVTQALRRLLGNAVDAAGSATLRLHVEDSTLAISVVDEGPGMSPAVLAAAPDPFYTTKEPGKGMGLGLYFTSSVANHLGGMLKLDSTEGEGTTAVLELPLDPRSSA